MTRVPISVKCFRHHIRPAIATLILAVSATVCGAQTWIASQVPLTVESQGRINAIAIDPRSSWVAVGSESGGLFLSNNPRESFRRVSGRLPNDIRDLAWLRSSEASRPANILLATTRHDYRLPNGGGLWRSTDRGETWNQAGLQMLLGLPAANDLDGFAISQDSNTANVAVATSMGLALTTDRGATWRVVNPFGPSANPNCAAVAYTNGSILVAGVEGLRWSTNDGRTWTAPRTALVGSNADNYHGLTWGAKAGMAYYVDWNTNLFYTVDYGQTWTSLTVPPVGFGGGMRFVYEATRGSVLDLYFSDTFKISRLTASADRRPEEIDFSGTWMAVNLPHPDPRCMAFNRSHDPYLLGTDGGLHTTDDRGSNWQNRPIRGLEALQIYDVNGQWVGTGRTRAYDVYVGTQDNALRATVPGWTWSHQYGGEGYFLQMRPEVPVGTPVITFTDLNPGFTSVGRYFSSPFQTQGAVRFSENSNPDLVVWAMQPRMLPSGRLIQPIRVGSGIRSSLRSGLAISNESERTWTQLTEFSEPWTGLPFVSQGRTQARIFEAYGAGWNAAMHRNRILLLSVTTSTVSYPNARTAYSRMEGFGSKGFGSIGTTDFQFVWIPVFDVHPTDLSTVLAADIGNGVVAQSTNGGDTWAPLRSLTDLLLHRGEYRFSTIDDTSFVTAISYCPMDPSRILVGCRTGGAYVSNDGGVSWRSVVYSDRMANITSFHWKSSSEAYASSYGTGLWQISLAAEVPIGAHAKRDQRTESATIIAQQVPVDGFAKPPYKGADLLTFVGGTGDPYQPRYSGREPISVRLVGSAPKLQGELEVFLDGRRLSDRQYKLEPNINQLIITNAIPGGGHILRVVWKRGQTQVETGGMFFMGTGDKSN